MANNRMYLVFRPTGEKVFLGKRLAHGWYGVPEDLAHRLEEMFERVQMEDAESQDDFVLEFEAE